MAQGELIVLLLGLIPLTGLLAGAYPAFFLSSFLPVQAIRGGLRSGKGAVVVRQILVVTQFIATVFLIIAATVISRQLRFMMHRDLGFDRDNILVIQSVPREWNLNGVQRQEVLKQALMRLPEISAATLSFDVPSDYGSGSLELTTNALPEGQTVTAKQFTVDESYLKTFNLPLTEGRFFSNEFFHSDTANAIVLNQAAVDALSLQKPVGAQVMLAGNHPFQVIGVVENFSFNPLEHDDKPLALLYVYTVPIYRYLSLKLRSEDMVRTIARVQATWDEVYPDVPFEYRFMDQVLQVQYVKIQKMKIVSRYATVLAILVACLGLFGLVVFSAEQRTKEIGIRKVLGASMANVAALLSKDYARLVLLANAVAWPLAWIAMNHWLQNFVYRIEIDWWIFVLSGGLALVIALLTVSVQAIRTALTNPVDSLRYE